MKWNIFKNYKGKPTYMTAEEIISQLRKAIDNVYVKYEGNPLIEEEEDIMGEFEEIISSYYEDISPM